MRPGEIVKTLRKRITTGEFPPGTALPLRRKLLEEYGSSVATFQKCINQLMREGFLESRGAKGTVVCCHPPHLFHYGLIFPSAPPIPAETDSFFPALRQTAEEFAQEHSGVKFRFYHAENPEKPEISELQELQDAAQKHLLAGIFFVNFAPSRPLQQKLRSLPCVVISRLSSDTCHPYPTLEFDLVKLFRCCREELQRKGCKRIAALVPDMVSNEKLIQIQQLIGKNHPERMIGMNHQQTRPLLNKNLLKLLFHAPDHPDGLAVLNENFLPLLEEVLPELGLKPGSDVKIASHCNVPSTIPKIQTIDYFAYSAREVLESGFRLLNSPGATVTMIQPRRLEEL